MKQTGSCIVASLIFITSVKAQVPFITSPTWQSADVASYSTGAAWADINKDGWLDLVVADGNDIARQHVKVYLNSSRGSLPAMPSWQSADIDYHGHLSVGDVNNDGYPDVAVSVYLGVGGGKGKLKLYVNRSGTIESTPSWASRDSFSTFSCAFGDANGDGYLDLAAACGEPYGSRPEKNRVYYNHGGQLDSLPGWMSSELSYSCDVGWADFDNNGSLDLVFANEQAPDRIYRNYRDSIGTVPIWSSADASQYANSLAIADVNNDGYLDLAISDNFQMGGTGRFKIYLNNGGPVGTTPWWTSAWYGYGSGIALADIDHDGDKDLVTGAWWDTCRVYMNNSSSFSQTPQWQSATTSTVEAIVFGDYDNVGLDTINIHFMSDGLKKLYYLPRAPLQRILSVTWNGDPDSVSRYCCDVDNGWMSFSHSPSPGVSIDIRAVASRSLDFAVSNWDDTVGNYVFRNVLPPYHGARITVSTSRIDFGPVEAGHTSDTVDIVVGNLGPDTLIVSSISNALSGFRLVNVPLLPLHIPALGNVLFGVVSQPSEYGTFTDTVTIVSSDSASPASGVALNAKGVVIGRARPGAMYAAGQSWFYTVNTSTGVATLIGPEGISEIDGLAIRPSSMELYGTCAGSFSTKMYRISEQYGDALLMLTVDVPNMRAIAFSPTDELFAATTTGRLYRINPATGDTVFVGSSGLVYSGLAFNPTSGELWASVRTVLNNRDRIYKVNTSTGAASLVGGTGDNAITPSIAFDPLGILYGLKGTGTQTNTLIRIDTTTAAGTTVGPTGVSGLLAIAMRTDSLVTGVPEYENGKPSKFALHQNYPNPFNPGTTISYQLPTQCHVTLKVFDVLGSEVATLVNRVEGPGDLSVQFSTKGGSAYGGDASRFSSGVYFYQLKAGASVLVRRMLLLK
jgi:hypothetical protein